MYHKFIKCNPESFAMQGTKVNEGVRYGRRVIQICYSKVQGGHSFYCVCSKNFVVGQFFQRSGAKFFILVLTVRVCGEKPCRN